MPRACIKNRKHDTEQNKILKIYNKKRIIAEKKAIIAGIILLYAKNKSKKGLMNKWRKKYDLALDAISRENEDIPKNYEVLSKYIHEEKTNFYHYVSASLRNNICDNCLIMLKGWSSSTPLINSPNFRNQKFGGGFYIRYNGVGIAVDPGCNFVENMHEQGLYISDIDYVIITHSHIDHCHDMDTLATMNYEYNKIIKNRSFPKFKELDTHIIRWYVDSDTYKKISENNDFQNDQHECYKLGFGRKITHPRTIVNTEVQTVETELKEVKIKINYFLTLHRCEGSLGIKIELSDNKNQTQPITIGYTSDTAYFENLKENLKKCDILIANISELCHNDLLRKTVESDSHLRLQGCISLIEGTDPPPKISIISEFWGGKDDIRLYIAKFLNDRFNTTIFRDKKTETNVLAGDVGLSIKLDNLHTKCSFCNGYTRVNLINTVLTAPYERLKYVCDNCSSRSHL